MDAVTFCFYFGIPLCFGLLQFFVTRSKKLSLGKKYIPLAIVGSISALTWSACFGYIPLPDTYLFDGQYQKAYLEFFGFEYRIIGVLHDEKGFYFSDEPDAPPPLDYHNLIQIVDDPKLNKPGHGTYALSKNWFAKRGYDNDDIRQLRNGLRQFFRSAPNSKADTRLWTSFKDDQSKLVDIKTGRFRNNFLQVSARATNEYRSKTDIAYMVNRFVDPNLMKFFSTRGITINADHFALAEMLQWIWRSAIRDDKPIRVYIPSRRMRELLQNWIEDMCKGDNIDE